MIYLDNAATTMRKPPEVIEAVARAMGSLGNDGRGVNSGSLSAGRVVYAAREKLAAFFGCSDAGRVCFTANSPACTNRRAP